MPHNHQNIADYHAGDALDIITTFEVDDPETDAATVLENATDIEWYLQENEDDDVSAALLTKTLTDGIRRPIDDPNLAPTEFAIHLSTDDTSGHGGKTLHHRARLTDADGDRSTVFTGTVTIAH